MAAKTRELDPEIFWQTVALFKDYDYAYAGFKEHPSATTGYPKDLLQLGDENGAKGFDFDYNDSDALQASNYKKRKFTNCCMFVEGALIGTAMQMPWAKEFGPSWTSKHHSAAMNNANDKVPIGPPRAYVDVGMAEELKLETLDDLEPDTVYVIQGAHHNWLIVDFDPKTRRCLRLEATFGAAEFNSTGIFAKEKYYGGVGHKGVGRVPISRKGWETKVSKNATWEKYRGALLADLNAPASKHYVCIAKVHFMEMGTKRYITMPFEFPKVEPRPAAYYYAQNEALDGGYFPLGLQRNVHTGIHLLPSVDEFLEHLDSKKRDLRIRGEEIDDSPFATALKAIDQKDPRTRKGDGIVTRKELLKNPLKQPVYCMAPGTIVAARLPGLVPLSVGPAATTEPLGGRAKDLTGSHHGFVLVRHDLTALKDDGKPDEAKKYSFYSLYMHLIPPNWGEGTERIYYGMVPWLNKLIKPSQGAVIGLDPTGTGKNNFAQRFWPAPLAPRSKSKFRQDQGLVKGQYKFQAYGTTYDQRTEISTLAYASETTAVRRDPEERFKKCWDVLSNPANDDQVLTFSDPYLTVGGGELLGFVLPEKGDAKAKHVQGFLHWEVLAPVSGGDSGIKKLLGLAESELGLSPFKQVNETQNDNFLEPDEIKKLLQALHADDNKDDGGTEKLFGDPADYSVQDLITAMHDSKRLQFSTPAPTGAPAAAAEPTCTNGPFFDHDQCDGQNFCYEASFEIKAYEIDKQPSVDGEIEFRVTFEPKGVFSAYEKTHKATVSSGVASLKVPVPAAARRVVITPVGDLELDPRPPKEGDDKDIVDAQLKALLPLRWRNVAVEHFNEWTRAGLEKSVTKRFGNFPGQLTPFIDSLAWWGHKEKPISESIFGSGDGKLPSDEDATLHNVHPVSFAWLLSVLVRRQKVAFTPPGEKAGAKGALDPLFAGWVPVVDDPKPFRVGDESVHAISVSKGELNDGEGIKLQVKGDQEVVLGPFQYTNGVLAVRPAPPLWGKYTFKVQNEAGDFVEAPNKIGTGEVEFLQPLMAVPGKHDTSKDQQEGWGLLKPEKLKVKKGYAKYQFTVRFRQHCPMHVSGWVVLGIRKQGMPWKEVKTIAIPCALRHITEMKGKVKYDGPFIVGGKKSRSNPAVGPWNFKSYGTPRIHENLPGALAKIKEKYRAEAKTKNERWLGLRPNSDKSGLSARLYGTKARLNALEAAAKEAKDEGLIASYQKVPADPKKKNTPYVEVKVEAPETEGEGKMQGVFDPRPALGRVLADNPLKNDEELDVWAGYLFAQGLTPQNELGIQEFKSKSWREVAKEVPYRLGWSMQAMTTVTQPRFGTVSAVMGWEKKKAAKLVVSVSLEGGEQTKWFWKGARPAFEIIDEATGKPITWKTTKLWGSANKSGNALVAELTIKKGYAFFGKKLKITPKATRASTFGDALIEPNALPTAASFAYGTTPKITPAHWTPFVFGTWLRLRMHTQAIPYNTQFEVRILDGSGDPVMVTVGSKKVPLAVKLAQEGTFLSDNPEVKGKPTRREMGGADHFQAYFKLSELKDAARSLPDPKQCVIEVRPVGKVLGETIASVKSDPITP